MKHYILLSAVFAVTVTSEIPCSSDIDCKISSGNGQEIIYKCVDNICTYNKNITITMATSFGNQCNVNEDCNLKFSRCKDNKCACKDQMVLSDSLSNTCIPVARKLGHICVQDSQCPFEDSACLHERCTCSKGFTSNYTTMANCYKTRPLGSSCSDNSDCDVMYSECSLNGECVCKERFLPYEDECVPISFTILSPCKVDVQCRKNLGDHSICMNRLCQCKYGTNFVLSKKKCIDSESLHVRAGSSLTSYTNFLLVFTLTFFGASIY